MISFAVCCLFRCLLDCLSMFRTYGCDLVISFAVAVLVGALGATLGDLERSGGVLGTLVGRFGATVEHSWTLLGCLGALFWVLLGRPGADRGAL